jgi:hypothetical protein
VTWRKDSALNDKGNNGENLSGGYYDGKTNLLGYYDGKTKLNEIKF